MILINESDVNLSCIAALDILNDISCIDKMLLNRNRSKNNNGNSNGNGNGNGNNNNNDNDDNNGSGNSNDDIVPPSILGIDIFFNIGSRFSHNPLDLSFTLLLSSLSSLSLLSLLFLVLTTVLLVFLTVLSLLSNGFFH